MIEIIVQWAMLSVGFHGNVKSVRLDILLKFDYLPLKVLNLKTQIVLSCFNMWRATCFVIVAGKAQIVLFFSSCNVKALSNVKRCRFMHDLMLT